MASAHSVSEVMMSPLELRRLFERAEKPESEWRVGVECERFGVHRKSGAPLGYDGAFGVLRIFDWLIERRGYLPERELPDGPVVAVKKGGLSLTLEPGAQFELSAAAVSDLHQVTDALCAYDHELLPISEELDVAWLSLGFHPFAAQRDLPWVPKQRYAIMREYLPKRGSGALDMMRRTATVQGNFDYSNELDALKKLMVALRLSPIINAWVANSPYVEGRARGKLSVRGDVWLRMEPERSGLLGQLWQRSELGYADYIEWALDAPMFLIKRAGKIIDNSGQTFRDFMASGFQGQTASFQDWQLHINSLFPEARLKSTLELRSVDCLHPKLATSVIALFTGILYDATALADARAVLGKVSFEQASAARPQLVSHGLSAAYGPYPGFALAADLLSVARAGLERRARLEQGKDETGYLEPLEQLLSERASPASKLLDRFGEVPDRERLIAGLAASG